MCPNIKDNIRLPVANADVLSVSPDLRFATATGNIIQVWEIKKQSFVPLYTIEAPEPVTGLAFPPEQGLLFASLSNKTLMGWSTTAGYCCYERELPGISHKLSFSSDGSILAVAVDENVYLFRPDKNNWQKIPSLLSRVIDLEWYKNRHLIVLHESCIHAVNQDGELLWIRDLHRSPLCLTIHQVRRLVAVAFDDALWLHSLDGRLQGVYFVEKAIIDMVFPRKDSALVLVDKDMNVLLFSPPALLSANLHHLFWLL